MIKMFISDLDGTLNDKQDISEFKNTITSQNVEAVKLLKNSGVLFGILTGNNFEIAKLQTKEVSNYVDLFSTHNGAFIIKNENIIGQNYFKPNQLKKILNFCLNNNLLYIVEEFDKEYYEANLNSKQLDVLKKLNYNSNLIPCFDFCSLDVCKIQIKVFENIENVRNKLLALFSEFNITIGDNFTIDVSIVTSSKKHALMQICKLYKFSLDEIAYIGDNENDIEAISILKYGFIMKSSNHKYQKYAKYVVSDVKSAIDICLKINKSV